MKFHIPFTLGSFERVKKRAAQFKKLVRYRRDSKLSQYLKNSDVEITREEYIAICIRGFVLSFVLIFLISFLTFIFIAPQKAIFFSFSLSFVFALFVFFSRSIYPKVYYTRKEREIEGNLLSALEDILVQLNAGVPLFSVLVNISSSDYGALSTEFKKIVKKINAGYSQIEVFEDAGENNPSLYFRRTLWQISNGLRAGSDLAIVISDSIRSLNEEQLIQIQNYGNKLNPLVMFYMIISVILPALSITFLTIISSLVNLSGTITKLLFLGMFFFVMLAQIMFLGVIKSARPSLL